MLKALKASKRKPTECSPIMWKSLKAEASTLKKPGPRTLPLRLVPKWLVAGGPKAQTPLSTPGVSQGIVEGSSPNHCALLRWTTLILRYWLGRELPKLCELFE